MFRKYKIGMFKELNIICTNPRIICIICRFMYLRRYFNMV